MAVDVYSYGTTTGVQQKVGWVVPARTFSGTTVPTTTEVENIIDQIAAEIHAKLAEAGYPVSTKAVVLANAPHACKWLEMLNESGACAEIVMSFAVAGDPESAANTPASYWKSRYKDGKDLIMGRFLNDLGLTRTNALSSHLVSGSTYDTDGNLKAPFFKKRMWEVPGETADEE